MLISNTVYIKERISFIDSLYISFLQSKDIYADYLLNIIDLIML